jgi:DNA-binding GntR family transcriptional regulator
MPLCIQYRIRGLFRAQLGVATPPLLAELPLKMPSPRRNAAPRPRAERPAQLGPQILSRLRERILNWHYPPGYHLGEQALCDEFAASRIPVREALRALAGQGLVDSLPNQGCYVKQPDVEKTHQLFDLRLALELFVGEALAQKKLPRGWSESERAYWQPLLSVKADARADGDELVRADENFHLSLARTLGNPYIVQSLQDINERLRFVRLAVVTTPHRLQETAGEHLKILDALDARNVEAVRRGLRENINHARNKVEIAISRALMAAHWRK